MVGNENGVNFSIENKSDHPVENVRFTTSEYLHELKFKIINPNEKVSGFLNMEQNRSDGSYVIEFTGKGEKKVAKGFGYYTNGGALEKWAKFQIKNDTVISEFGGIPY
ncbi:MAG: hypothetical protein ACXWFC_13535 [Nitrososphaeraceae archaeon]